MFKFGGFKASLNFYNGNRSRASKEREEIGSVVSITGAFRTNRDEFFGYNYPDSQRKITPSTVPITTTEQPTTPLRQVKSTSDLIKNKNLPQNLLQVSDISQDPRGAEQNETKYNNKSQDRDTTKGKRLDAEKIVDKQRLNEQKKIEKQRLDEEKKVEKQRLEEQKKRDKLALQEQGKQEKLKKEREKREAQQAKKDKKKRAAPPRPALNPLGQAKPTSSNNPLGQGPNNPLAGQMQYATNTLDSSISKSSGPPPYSEILKPDEKSDSTGNVTYAKPIDTGSWDMISKHRQDINRPMNTGPAKQTKQTTLDLNYNVDQGNEDKENSEA